MIVQFREPFFIALCYYQILPERTGTFVGLFDVLLSIMISASEQKKVRSFP